MTTNNATVERLKKIGMDRFTVTDIAKALGWNCSKTKQAGCITRMIKAGTIAPAGLLYKPGNVTVRAFRLTGT